MIMNTFKSMRKIYRIYAYRVFCLIIVLLVFGGGNPVLAITQNDLNAIKQNTPFYDPEEDCLTTPPSSTGKTIYVIGDSLTVGMRDNGDLSGKLEAKGWVVKGIEATDGDTVTKALQKIDGNAEAIKSSDNIVVALGTNPESSFDVRINELIAKLHEKSSSAQISWVNAYSLKSGYEDANATLVSQSNTLSFKIIDWKAEALKNPGTYPFAPDGIHHTTQGYKAKADFISQTLGSPSDIGTNPQTGNNLDYAGRTILTDGQLQTIRANQPFYEKSAQTSDIPWQMLAVVHLRESGLSRSNPANGQGVYQFVGAKPGEYPTGPVSDQEFQRQTDLAADFIKGKASGNIAGNTTLTAQNPSTNAVKDTFFGYNGRSDKYAQQAAGLGFDKATQPFEGSPYVMNKADAKRDPATAVPNTWGQVKRDHGPIEYPANNDYGAFVEYGALTGIKSGDSCNDTITGDARQKIVGIAQQELALWTSGTLKPGTDFHKYSQGRNENWCADFSSWVYKQAGVPLIPGNDGNVPGVDAIRQIGVKNGTYHDKNGYTPQPGDIVVRQNNGSHVNLVISVEGSKMHVIGGNQGGGDAGYQASKVSAYDDQLDNSGITGYVSPEGS